MKAKPTTVTGYIAAAPAIALPYLKQIRAILKSVAPKAKESLKWGNPVFEENRILFAYAAFKKHINFMPTPSVIEAFRTELEDYATGMGSVQLPYDKPLPKRLIRKMAALRAKDVRENDSRWM